MTEDEEAEFLSFSGKTIDGKLYVDFEDFNRLRLFVSKHFKSVRDVNLKLQEMIKRLEESKKRALDRDYEQNYKGYYEYLKDKE